MDADRLFSVAVGVILLAGIGATATTLQTSVETTPDEAIDVDEASLPVGADDFGRYDGEDDGANSGSNQGDSGGASTNPDSDSERDGNAKSDSSSAKKETRPASGDSENDGDSKQPMDGGQNQNSGDGSDESLGEKYKDDDQSLLEWLLSLLRSLLALIAELLPLVVLLGLAAVAVAERERIAAFLSRFVDSGDGADDPDGPAPRPAPTNDVAQAWYEMVALVDADVSRTASPRDFANRAVAAGADRSAVERVTSAFEEVRYGHAEVTPERRQRAREGIADIRAQLGVNR